MPEDEELALAARKIAEAKAAAAEEKESRPFNADDDVTAVEPPQHVTDEGATPS